jgi:hypothetical protein
MALDISLFVVTVVATKVTVTTKRQKVTAGLFVVAVTCPEQLGLGVVEDDGG